MPLTPRLLILVAAYLTGCGASGSTAPRLLAGETGVTATITSIADVALFGGDGPAVHAQVSVRNVTNESVVIIPCSSYIEARRPSSETWINIGLARVGLCPISPTALAPGDSTELGASGSSTEFRVLAGADARAIVIRARFLVQSGAEAYFVQSGEFTVMRP